MGWVEHIRSYFSGRDVFLSYRRSDGLAYAEALVRALRARQLTVYADWSAALPGDAIPEQTIRALKRCRLLVLVGTPEALQSRAIALEIEIWSATGRAIIPIDVGGALEEAARAGVLWHGVIGAARVPESETAIRDDCPAPSERIVTRIDDSATFMRQERRLRAAILGTVVTVGALLLAGLGIGWMNVRSARSEMKSAMRRASQLQQQASDAAATARAQEKLAADAEAARVASETAKARADLGRELALSAARTATTEATRQERIGAALRLAQEASTILRQQPARVTDASVLAIRSVRELRTLGIHALATDSAIREAGTLVPEITRQVRYSDGVKIKPIVTPNGRFIATAGKGNVTVFDLESGAQRVFARGYEEDEIDSIAISADGSRVAAVCYTTLYDRYIRVWPGPVDIPAGVLLDAIALSDDGTYLATATSMGPPPVSALEIFDTRTGARIAAGRWPATSYLKLIFSHKSDMIAVSSSRCSGVWAWREGATYLAPAGNESIAFTKHDENLAATIRDGWVYLWNWRKWKERNALPEWQATFYGPEKIGFSGEGATLWVIYDGGRIRLVHFFSKGPRAIRLVPPLEGDTDGFPAADDLAIVDEYVLLAASDDTTRLYYGSLLHPTEIARVAVDPDLLAMDSHGNATVVSSDGAVRLQGRPPMSPHAVYSPLHAISADLATVAQIRVRNERSGTSPREFWIQTIGAPGQFGRWKMYPTALDLTAITLSPSQQVLTGTADGFVHVWNHPIDAAKTPPAFAQGAAVRSVDVSSTGRVAVAAGTNVNLWELQNGTLLRRRTVPHPERVTRVVFGQRGDLLATVGEDKRIRVWRLSAGGAMLVRTYPADRVLDITFGGADRYLAASMRDGIAIWDVSATSQSAVMLHVDDATTISFAPSGARLAMAGKEGVVSIWDWQSKPTLSARIPVHRGATAVRFSRDGSNLWIYGSDTRVVPANDDAIAADVCRRLAIADPDAHARACVNDPLRE